MLNLTQITHSDSPFDDVLTLPYELRQKSRLVTRTDKGVEIGVVLPRGQSIRAGSVLSGDEAFKVLVKAAVESVSLVRCDDMLAFAKACYHMGNRHVGLQILPSSPELNASVSGLPLHTGGEFRYLRDHVLDHMLEGLGLSVEHAELPFEPEAGAYHSHDH